MSEGQGDVSYLGEGYIDDRDKSEWTLYDAVSKCSVLCVKVFAEYRDVKKKLSDYDTLDSALRRKDLEIKMLREQRNQEVNTNLLLVEWKFDSESKRLTQYDKEVKQLDDEILTALTKEEK